MIGATLLTEIVTLASAINSLFGNTQRILSEFHPLFSETCQEIASSISSASNVYEKMSAKYLEDISHFTSSSTQFAECSFEPGTPEDVGIAVKGGGHTTNLGFSSTEGVQIAMTRFSEVVYHSKARAVSVGAGLTWDDVYEALERYGVSVAGGRISGVGVAGYTLGGGYSWHTNQYGLTIDNVLAYELVTPNGTVIDVTEASSPDLFFALKGGMNNYGIVTRFTFKTFPQTQVWGGLISYSEDVLDQFVTATTNFAANNTDPKAGIIALYHARGSQFGGSLNIFYDAPTQPAGIFDEFLAIPSSTRDISTRSFLPFLKSLLPLSYNPPRLIFHSISLAFLPSLFSHNMTPSAYPPSRTQGFFPLNIHFAWNQTENDQAVYDAARMTAGTLQAHSMEDGSGVAPPVVYPNYAMFGTPVVNLFGEHLPRLQAIKVAVDPDNVMGLAGGFKI
ncbi:FAD-binding domain-containing protein [Chiua virens]|nr:FAD-binding domain-containing protein [Chiua virens]